MDAKWLGRLGLDLKSVKIMYVDLVGGCLVSTSYASHDDMVSDLSSKGVNLDSLKGPYPHQFSDHLGARFESADAASFLSM